MLLYSWNPHCLWLHHLTSGISSAYPGSRVHPCGPGDEISWLAIPESDDHLWNQRVGSSLQITLGKNEGRIFFSRIIRVMRSEEERIDVRHALNTDDHYGDWGNQVGRVLKWFYWNCKTTLYYKKFHSSVQNLMRSPLLNCFILFGQIKGF